MYKIKILPNNVTINAEDGEDLLSVQIKAGFSPDAPCGGKGTCGKCLVDILGEQEEVKETVKACQYPVHSDLVIRVYDKNDFKILETGIKKEIVLDPSVKEGYGAAFDIGTTSVVCYLLDLTNGQQIAKASMLNPQSQFGADVISRCEYALENGTKILSDTIREALNDLISQACADTTGRGSGTDGKRIVPEDIRLVTIVGNTCMHHLFMNIDPKSLTVAPYEAVVKDEIIMKAAEADIHVHPEAVLQVLPNIAGFVGADTVGCILASSFDQLDDLSLMIDIGTNGEMVMGNKDRMVACSTAAGPAFEGAKIECGMRGTTGAIDHVKYENGKLICHVIGQESAARVSETDLKDKGLTGKISDTEKNDAGSDNNVSALGICGSGLMDAVAVALEAEIIDETGRIDTDCDCVFELPDNAQPAIRLLGDVYLSQKDIREVQLAKGAIAAGIELLADELGIKITDVKKVMIAGAFGNYMDPHSSCTIGMIPSELENRIEMIGNAAGEGSIIATLNKDEFLHAQEVREKTDFLELASSPDFQDIFVDNLLFE